MSSSLIKEVAALGGLRYVPSPFCHATKHILHRIVQAVLAVKGHAKTYFPSGELMTISIFPS